MHITPMSTFGWIVTGRVDARSLVGRDKGWLLYMLVVQRVGWKVWSWYFGPRWTQQTTMTRWTVSTLWSGSQDNYKTITAQHTGQLSYSFGQCNIPQQTKRQTPNDCNQKGWHKKWLDKHNIPYMAETLKRHYWTKYVNIGQRQYTLQMKLHSYRLWRWQLQLSSRTVIWKTPF